MNYVCDDLKLYYGYDVQITNKITVTIPTIEQIVDFGEHRYFSAVHNLTSVGADLKWQLWEKGIDYTKIEDYDLFIKLISFMVSSRKEIHNVLTTNPDYEEDLNKISEEDLEEMLINPLQLVLKDVDLADFVPCQSDKNDLIILYDKKHDITIDKFVYTRLVEVVRKIHGFKRNNQIPANERTKMDLIEDARDEAMMNKNKPKKSILKPLVSALQGISNNSWIDIQQMNICMFFDSIKRAGKIQDATLLLQGAYSGFANLKGIDKSRLDWTAEI